MNHHSLTIGFMAFLCTVLCMFSFNNLCAASDFKCSDETCRVRMLADGAYFEELAKAVGHAEKEIIMAFYLFKTNGYRGNYPDRLLEGLVKAAKRGVHVRVILERTDDDDSSINRINLATAARLRTQGIDVRFDSPSVTTHVKMVIIDERWTFVGSHNMTNSALKYNHEMSLLVESPEIAKSAAAYLNSFCR